jgi:hypothetical protein
VKATLQTAYVLGGVVAVVAVALFASGDRKVADNSNGLPAGTVILNPPQGYRRATALEVTQDMRSAAATDLRANTLGTVVEHEGFSVGIESHFDERRGWHKGASVFVPI